MKKLLSLTLAILLLLPLSSCSKEKEPPAPSDMAEERVQSPYTDANTTDRYYLSRTGDNAGFVYGDDYYYCTEYCTIVAVPLGEAVKHNVVVEGKVSYVQEFTTLCADPVCKHNSVECPTMMRDPYAEFLIDAAESNGEQPVIYYFRATSETWEEDGSITVHGSEIIRYDVAEGTATQVTFSDKPIEQLMSYGDYLYFTTQTSEDTMEFNTVKKTGGEVNSLTPGDSYLRLIGANKQAAYVNDDKGNVYAIDPEGESYELIYTVAEVYHIGIDRHADLNMFTEGDYLYFFADHEIETAPMWDDSGREIERIKHTIRRVKLDDPSGEGELVAESVFEKEVYGVYNGVLYYGPFDLCTQLEGKNIQPLYHSKGTIKGVNLETLETFNAVTDCGFNFEAHPYYINDRCIIGIMQPYREIDFTSKVGFYIMLLDFETGGMYCVNGNPNLLTAPGQ